MRFGFCAPVEHAKMLAAIGYDYIEPPLASTLTPLDPSDDVLKAAASALALSDIRPEVFNVFLPGTVKIVGPEADRSKQEEYLLSALNRVRFLGGKIIVFGSAGARTIPDGFSEELAYQQILGFLKLAGPIAADYDIRIVVEPLNKGECNFINSVAEGTELVKKVNSKNVDVLSDLYHVNLEGQSYDETRDAGFHLRHVHVAGAQNRRIPTLDDVDYLAGFFSVLKQMGYSNRISIEGIASDIPAEAEVALTVLKDAWAKA